MLPCYSWHWDTEKPLLCVPDVTPGTGGWNRVAFLGIVHLPRGEMGEKEYFLFQVEKQGVSSWSDLVSLLGPGRGKNVSHLDISSCRRKFLRQQLLKCAILTFFLKKKIIFIFEMQKWSCRWSRRAGIWNFFVLVCMFRACSGKFLWLCINSSTLVGLGWLILRLPNTWTLERATFAGWDSNWKFINEH